MKITYKDAMVISHEMKRSREKQQSMNVGQRGRLTTQNLSEWFLVSNFTASSYTRKFNFIYTHH